MKHRSGRHWLFALLAVAGLVLAAVAGIVAIVLGHDHSGSAVVYIGAGALAAFSVGAGAVAGVRRLLGLPGSARWGLALGSALVALPALSIGVLNLLDVLQDRAVEAAPADVVALLDSHSHLLDGVGPASGYGDLEPLRARWNSRQIVALGEATHGTSEFFLLKHRLVRFLVEELGFRHFAMEIQPELGRILDDFIQGGDSSPVRALYWPWATEEYLGMLAWMRTYNLDRDAQDRIRFHGIDPKVGNRDEVMARNVLAIRKTEGPGAKVVVWAANSHVRAALGGMGEYLRDELGDDVYLLGLEFHHGVFSSRTRTVRLFEAGPFPHTHYSHALAQLPGDVRFLDVLEAASAPKLEAWLRQPRSTNHKYELYAFTRLVRAFPKVRTPLPELFDGVIFIRQSTPPTPIRAAAPNPQE